MPRFRCAPLNPCRRSLVVWSVWTLLFAAALASGPSSEPIDLGSRLEPLVDRFLIQSLSGDARLQLHQPQRREVVLVHDVPWEGNLTAHHTLFRDGDRYRMYYGGRHYQPGQKVRHVLVCYAESRDGIHWTRPNLGQFEYEGSRANNIVWMDDPGADSEQRNPMAVFKDSNPAAAPDARYKSIARGDDGVYALKSPDGIHWSLLAQEPVIPKGDMGLDSQNLAFWDGLRGRYVCYLRSGRTHPTGQRVRDVKTAVSHDFLTWTEPVFLEYPGAPVEHLYTNQIRPYARAPHIYLGFPKRFVPERNQDREFSGVSDGVFMSSRDGVRFHRWGEAVVRPGLQPERWMTRNNMIGWGILTLPSSVAGEPDELSIYVTESYYSGPASRLRPVHLPSGRLRVGAGASGRRRNDHSPHSLRRLAPGPELFDLGRREHPGRDPGRGGPSDSGILAAGLPGAVRRLGGTGRELEGDERSELPVRQNRPSPVFAEGRRSLRPPVPAVTLAGPICGAEVPPVPDRPKKAQFRN